MDAHDCIERWNIYIFFNFSWTDGGLSSCRASRSRSLSFTVRKAVLFFVFLSLKSTLHWRYCRCIVVCLHSSGPHVHIQRLFIKLTVALLPCRVFFFSSGSSLFSFYGAVSVHCTLRLPDTGTLTYASLYTQTSSSPHPFLPSPPVHSLGVIFGRALVCRRL